MGDISAVVYALAVPFACGVAVQRLLAILDAFDTWTGADATTRASISAFVSFLCGLVVAIGGHIRILAAIAVALKVASAFKPDNCIHPTFWATGVDVAATALIVSAGTEGFNSIIKFLGYAKEQTKATAAAKTQAAKTQGTKVDNADVLQALHS